MIKLKTRIHVVIDLQHIYYEIKYIFLHFAMCNRFIRVILFKILMDGIKNKSERKNKIQTHTHKIKKNKPEKKRKQRE